MFEMLKIFSSIPMVIAALGLILATSSFISGLQLTRGANIIEGKIHRYNGFTSMSLYLTLAVISMFDNGIRFIPLMAWMTGLLIILTKLWIVRKKRRRRAYKYVSWIGGTMILMWLYLVIIHIPI